MTEPLRGKKLWLVDFTALEHHETQDEQVEQSAQSIALFGLSLLSFRFPLFFGRRAFFIDADQI